MKTLTEIISALVEENRVARQAHRAKVEKRAEELNAGWAKTRFGREYFDKVVAPTWGKDDRPHAPFDGYLWENELGEVEAYHAGSYLPYVTEFDSLDKPEYTGDHGWWKLRLTQAEYKELREYGYPLEVRIPYKEWKLQDGTDVVMAEVRAHKSILEAIQEHSKQVFDNIFNELNKNKGDAPEGRVTVSGTVTSVKVYEDYYGVQCKMMVVLENGATVYGSLPKSIPFEYRGKVRFTATFELAKDDKTHAFYKRPSKVIMLEE